MSCRRSITIQDIQTLKEKKTKEEGGTKPKRRWFQQSTSTKKATFNAPMTGLDNKVFDFRKQKHIAGFTKNCGVILKFITVNYKNGGPWMTMTIKKMDKPTINMP